MVPTDSSRPVLMALASGNPPEPTTENRSPSDGADFVVEPDDHSPDAGTAYALLSRGEGPWDGSRGLEPIDFYKITTQETTFEGCTPNNARAFGIDRGNDEEGTSTPVSEAEPTSGRGSSDGGVRRTTGATGLSRGQVSLGW